MIHDKVKYNAAKLYNDTRKAIGCPDYIKGDIIIECKNTAESTRFIFDKGTKLLLIGFECDKDGSVSIIAKTEEDSSNTSKEFSPKFIIDNFKFSAEDTFRLYSVYEYKDVLKSLRDEFHSSPMYEIHYVFRDVLIIEAILLPVFAFFNIAITSSLFSIGSVFCVIIFFILLIIGAIYKYIDEKLNNQLESIKCLQEYIEVSTNEVLSGTYNDNSFTLSDDNLVKYLELNK